MDFYLGGGSWIFGNGAFTSDMIGGTVTVAGSPEPDLNDTFTIDAVDSTTEVDMSPAPAGGPVFVDAETITLTYTPPAQFNAGPKIVGVSVIPEVKDGMNKLGSDRRAT